MIKKDYPEKIDCDLFKQQKTIEDIFENLGCPYSQYLVPEEYERFVQDTSGQYNGIGVEVRKKNFHVEIISVFRDSPAEDAGLESKDKIIAIDGVSAVNENIQTVIRRIKGKPGSEVTLTVLRSGYIKPLNVTVCREKIRLKDVDEKFLDGDIGYIRLLNFTHSAGRAVTSSLSNLNTAGARGIILDLRDNSGGYLAAALEVADIFVPGNNPILKIRTASEDVNVLAKQSCEKMPLVILINEGSASASEIVAGAIKDYNLGKLVGTNTYGKGTIQSIKKIKNVPNAAIKLTTAEYFSAKGNRIQSTGISPDYYVEHTDKQFKAAKEVLLKNVLGQCERFFARSDEIDMGGL